jgi:uncharacterized protein (TIGR02246 family)
MGALVCTTEFEPSQMAGSRWDASAAREGIQELLERFTQAWNRHDAAALAATFVPTGDLLNSQGLMALGRAEVEGLLGREFEKAMRETRIATSLTHLRFLTPDIALADADQVVEGLRKPDGTVLPQVRMHVAFVAREEAPGRWGFSSVRPYVLPPRT